MWTHDFLLSFLLSFAIWGGCCKLNTNEYIAEERRRRICGFSIDIGFLFSFILGSKSGVIEIKTNLWNVASPCSIFLFWFRKSPPCSDGLLWFWQTVPWNDFVLAVGLGYFPSINRVSSLLLKHIDFHVFSFSFLLLSKYNLFCSFLF